MKKLLPALLAAVLLLQFAAGISSAEAAAAVGEYVGTDNLEKMDIIESPLEYRETQYYVFYYPPPPVSKNRLVAAVASSGQAVDGDDLLGAIALSAHKYAVWQILESTYYLSFGDFSAFSSDFRKRLAAASPEAVISSIQSTYPSVTLLQVEGKLSLMEAKLDLLSEVLDQGMEKRAVFTTQYASDALSNLFSHYVRTFSSFREFLDAAEAYQSAVLDAQDKVRNSKNLTVSEKESVLKALSPLYDAGNPGKFKDSFKSGAAYYDSSALDAGKWANDSVEGFLFLKAKVDALNAYAQVQPRVGQMLSNEFSFKACALADDWKKLSDAWKKVEALKLRATREAYLNMSARMGEADSMAVSLNDKYSRCIQATPTPAAGGETSSLVQAGLAVAVIALIGFAGYRYYMQKKQEQEERGE
ncbi:MAG: hypothetical protein NTY90_04695 [Candidatus Micrarchaeota archaeon]|nr:hypothetical protein [Candidatus Micrarchaeota archaeon]